MQMELNIEGPKKKVKRWQNQWAKYAHTRTYARAIETETEWKETDKQINGRTDRQRTLQTTYRTRVPKKPWNWVIFSQIVFHSHVHHLVDCFKRNYASQKYFMMCSVVEIFAHCRTLALQQRRKKSSKQFKIQCVCTPFLFGSYTRFAILSLPLSLSPVRSLFWTLFAVSTLFYQKFIFNYVLFLLVRCMFVALNKHGRK